MSRFHSYLTTALRLIESYQTGKTFAHDLKSFFSAEKKYGSRDRKIISSLCYQYFRTSHLLKELSKEEEKIISAVFLCENEYSDLLAFIRPEWNEKVQLPLEEKLTFLQASPEKIFPFINELSADIHHESFFLSLLKQPYLFIRIRPGKRAAIFNKLREEGIAFERVGEDSLKLPQNISLDKILNINRDVVIQDLSSQKVFDDIPLNDLLQDNRVPEVWDCCAASGGKSILFHDHVGGNLRLTVSDIRKNIIQNLGMRLAEAVVPVYEKFVQDLSVSTGMCRSDKYDVLICDVPCTGSGTWSRNPEQLHSFKINNLHEYSKLQQSIVSSVIPHVKEGGYLVYITCSVFARENEHVANFIKESDELSLLQMKYVKGYDNGADTMFVALFRR